MNFIDNLALYMPYALLLFLPFILYAANLIFKQQNDKSLSNENEALSESMRTPDAVKNTKPFRQPLSAKAAGALPLLVVHNKEIYTIDYDGLKLKRDNILSTSFNRQPSIQSKRVIQARSKGKKSDELLLLEYLSSHSDTFDSLHYYNHVRKSLRREPAVSRFKAIHSENFVYPMKNQNLAVFAWSQDSHLKHGFSDYYISAEKLTYINSSSKITAAINFLKFEALKEDTKRNRLLIPDNQRVS